MLPFECKLARYQCQFDVLMLRIFRDRQVRRFVVATFFALAFIWVAMRWFNVDRDVVLVFAILAFALIGILILLGFLFSFALHLFMRRDRGMLSKIEEEEEALKERHGQDNPDSETPKSPENHQD